MGYRRNQKTVRISFTGELEGLEVVTRHASTDTMRHIVAVAQNAQSGTLAERASRVLDLCDAVAMIIESWNYEDEDGTPIPATADALKQEDAAFAIALAYAWLDQIAARAEAMSQQSSERDAEIEGSLPMEVS